MVVKNKLDHKMSRLLYDAYQYLQEMLNMCFHCTHVPTRNTKHQPHMKEGKVMFKKSVQKHQ